jgi:hypothetical protein
MPRIFTKALQTSKTDMPLGEQGPFLHSHINGRLGRAWLAVCSCPCFHRQLVPAHFAFPF